MSLLRSCLLSLLCCLPVFANAAVLETLYQVNVPATEDAEEGAQLDTATRVMLHRLAGSSVALNKGALAEVMAEPSNVTRRIDAMGEDGSLRVEFDPLLLREALIKADVPMLGLSRPGILVWAVQSTMLGDEFLLPSSEMGQALREVAAYRGVALTQPLADLQDRTSVAEANVLEADEAVLAEASARYPAEGILALQVKQADELWVLQWTLWLNDQKVTGKAQADIPREAADTMMQELADAVFAQYAVTSVPSDQLTGWRLHVSGINSLDKFSRLQRMLQQMGTQDVPKLVSMKGSKVEFVFDFPGDEAQLQRMLMLDQRLIAVDAPVEPVEPVEPALSNTVDSSVDSVDSVSAGDASPASAGVVDAIEAPEAEELDVLPPALPSSPQDNRKSLYYRWR